MKTNLINKSAFKVTAKMHIFIIVSCVVLALGLAVGTICHFVANGFFNYSGDYASYKSVTVSYEDIDFSGGGKKPVDLIDGLCKEAFQNEGVSYYAESKGETSTGGEIVYKFVYSTDDESIENAVASVNNAIKEEVLEVGGIQFSYASKHTSEAELGGGLSLSRAAITIAVLAAVHFIYFAIRYKLTMALGAILADVHNLALFIAICALCRIPVASSVATYAVITVLLTIIGTSLLFDKMRRNLKDENSKKLSAEDFTDSSARECLKINLIMPACLAALSVVLFVLLSISSLSPLAVLAPLACSFVSFAVCAYGTALFVPAVYSRFKLLGDKYKAISKEKAKVNK